MIKQELTEKEDNDVDDKEVYHFITFVPYKNHLYELDSLQSGPILIGSFEKDDWLPLARKEINSRVHK